LVRQRTGSREPQSERAQEGDDLVIGPEVSASIQPEASAAPTRPVRHHRRFALADVTFEGEPVGGATIDAWQNAAGTECWSARVLMSLQESRSEGALAGRTRDGRMLRGQVSLGGSGAGLRSGNAVLVEWHGVGPLVVVEDATQA
jgi:hypothetical protein